MYVLEETVLPIPEKIKSIRKYLGLKQEDLTDGQISRSLISYIENGKVKLTRTVAETIAKCINEVLMDRNIQLDIDADYLMCNEVEQARIAIDKYLNKLEEAITRDDSKMVEKIIEKEKLWSKWDVPERQAIIYEFIGDFYYNNMKFKNGYIYYMKAHECNIKANNDYKSAEVVTKIARCSLFLKNYEESIELNKHALSILEKNNIESETLYERCLFNMAIAYKESHYLEKALKYLDELEDRGYNLSDSQYADIFTLRANVFLEKKEYNSAEIYYKKAVEFAERENDKERLSISYMNISTLYNEIGKIEKSIEYGKKALNIRDSINTKGREETLLIIGRRYKSLNEFDLAEKYLLRALKETDYTRNLNIKVQIYLELLDLYISISEHYLAMRLIEEVQELYSEISIEKSIKEIRQIERFLIKSINYLIDKDIEKSKKLLSILIEKGDEYEG